VLTVDFGKFPIEPGERVLDLGCGFGRHAFEAYRRGANVVAVDRSTDEVAQVTAMFRAMAAAGEAPAGLTARAVRADLLALPFPDASFDVVVSTLVLCTVPDPEAAVAELRRVLAPGGRLLFIEHLRADTSRLARWQDRLAPPWAAFASGCRCNRTTLDLLARTFTLDAPGRADWRGMPRIVRPLAFGTAHAASSGPGS